MSKNKGWRKLESQELFRSNYFHLRMDRCETQDGRIMPKYYVVDFPDWVQVVALDSRANIIVVKQYRYPGDGWFLEFPGGSTHPNRTEDPLVAAQRELLEETGYESESWTYVGYHYPNPALMNNRCHVYLAQDCTRTNGQNLDEFEVLEVCLMPLREFVTDLKRSDKIHSLMLATYALVMDHLPK